MNDLYIIPIFVPYEGCPNKCIFCNQHRITGTTKKVTAQDVKSTAHEYLTTMKNKNAAVELAFFGGSFTGIDMEYQKELLKAAKELIDEGKIDYVRLSTRPDYINGNILDYLKEYGVKVIELGVQSMDKEVLEFSQRGHTSEDVVKASRLIKKYGFVLGHQMMVGLPKDTFQKAIDTAKRLVELSPEIIRIYPALVIRDTEMEQLYRLGKFNPITLKEAVEWCKELYILFESSGIKVIRMGLQSSENISEDADVIAGPYHPSFREIVESRVYLEMIVDAISRLNLRKNINITANPSETSKVLGNKKENFYRLKELFSIETLNISTGPGVEKGSLIVENEETSVKVSKTFFINKEAKRRN